MKLSASNIAWSTQQDNEVLSCLKSLCFDALEVAPTRLFADKPYETSVKEIERLVQRLKDTYGLAICSMQSIWFGRSERIAGSREEYLSLLNYTGSAICFAERIGCRNLVFGCPKNRTTGNENEKETVKSFLNEAATIATEHGVVIALEANPAIYNTNFATHTGEAIQIIRELNNPGLMLNLDFGAIIENGEDVCHLEDDVDIISHVHVSEPYLQPIQRRKEHQILKEMLLRNGYKHYISLEMSKPDKSEDLRQSMDYLCELFGRE